MEYSTTLATEQGLRSGGRVWSIEWVVLGVLKGTAGYIRVKHYCGKTIERPEQTMK